MFSHYGRAHTGMGFRIMALCGNDADGMAGCATYLPITRRCMAPRIPFSRSIRPPGPSVQIDVLKK